MRRPQGQSQENDGAADLQVAALGYDAASDHAPKLLAKGRGKVAERIMELAGEHSLPVHRDPTLISVLGALDVGAEIPPDLYGVIAEVLAWAYHTDTLARTGHRAA